MGLHYHSTMIREASSARTVSFAASLAGRLLLMGVLPAAVIVGVILFWTAREKFEHLERIADGELVREALIAASEIEVSNFDAMQVARSIAAQQTSGLFGQRALTVKLLYAALEADDNITAAYVLYEPNADGNDAASAASDPKEWIEPTGRFIPYPFRDWAHGNTIEVKASIDYETSLYYDGVRRAFAESGTATTMVTEPYVYDGQLIVEQTHPIVIDGKFRGIGGADRALAAIEEVVRAGAKRVDATGYLISGRGKIIVATSDPEITPETIDDIAMHLRTHPVDETPLATLLEPLVRQAKDDGFAQDAIDPQNDQELLTVSVRIAAGNWTLVLTKPRELVVAPIRAEVWQSTLITLVALLGAAGVISWTAIATGRRMRRAALAADAIAAGDLSVAIAPSASNDEAGALTHSLQRMQSSLNDLLKGVKHAGITLDTSALELSATSKEQEAMAHRVGESASQIASATIQISTTGTELARTMSEVETAVECTAALAIGSRANLVAVDTTIRELADATQSIAAKLAAISERASSINSVVTTIAKVADQTNILSVNAAVEAEKAGEQGRGFLVVAREIRRLADQTAGATVDIESMVREMQGAVGAGVMEMDRFAEKVRRSVDEIVQTGKQMGDIIEQVEANAVRYRTVATGMTSQSQGATTISQSMGALASAAKRTVETAEEFGRTANDLQRASMLLRQSVASFTLHEDK